MKKPLAILLCIAMLLSTAACSADAPQVSEPAETTKVTAPVITEEVTAKLDAVLREYKYEGIVYLTHNGEVVYQSVSGTNDMGQPLTINSPMFLFSISKQFCAAAIMMLQDQGKLSLDDTLEKYFPEYTIGKDITIHNLLAMRSGIRQLYRSQMLNEPERYADMTPEQVDAAVLAWIFAEPLNFEPGTKYEYGDLNYILLSYVVEKVSGRNYEEFVRKNVFEPLGMTQSGFLSEVDAHPEWGLIYDSPYPGSVLGDRLHGCANIVSTAGDMDIWMTALQSGKVVCEESYREMTTVYSPEANYGYALEAGIRGGWGHSGVNAARMYFTEEYGYNFFIVTKYDPKLRDDWTERVSTRFLSVLFTAVDAVAE